MRDRLDNSTRLITRFITEQELSFLMTTAWAWQAKSGSHPVLVVGPGCEITWLHRPPSGYSDYLVVFPTGLEVAHVQTTAHCGYTAWHVVRA